MSLKEHGVIEGLVPNGGGWRYEQPFKGELERIPFRGDAGSAKRLVDAVAEFRVTNHIDLGDVEADVARYIKEVSPPNNRFPSRAQREAPPVKRRPIIERIRDRLVKASQTTPRLLLIDEAEIRAKTCSDCRQNVKWVTGCVPCAEDVKSRGQNLRQLPSTDEAIEGLGACRLHDMFLPAFVFVDRDELGDADPKAPDYCWMKTESISPQVPYEDL